jgi:dTMP kinase
MKYHVSFDIDFRRNTTDGLYIAVEGIDGSGKTTQVDRLVEYFQKHGREVIKTREPRKDEGLIGKLIQQILLGKTKVPSVAFQYLFSADREMHHKELILPALDAGKVVISDRCFWSAIPYGILDKEEEANRSTVDRYMVAQGILSMYHQFTVPDYTFYLDLPLDIAMQRIEKSDGAGEIYEDEKKLEKVIYGYQWLLKEFPKELIVIDARKSVGEVTSEILEKIQR